MFLCDLISQLLNKNPLKRLQSIAKIKEHQWFGQVDWDRVN